MSSLFFNQSYVIVTVRIAKAMHTGNVCGLATGTICYHLCLSMYSMRVDMSRTRILYTKPPNHPLAWDEINTPWELGLRIFKGGQGIATFGHKFEGPPTACF